MTEDEALKTRCCGPEGCGVWRWTDDGFRPTPRDRDPSVDVDMSQFRFCIASACMAWRWRAAPTPPRNVPTVHPDRASTWEMVPGEAGDGRCGLAGQP